jgi:O-antigen/teichoic acid export membrane protein
MSLKEKIFSQLSKLGLKQKGKNRLFKSAFSLFGLKIFSAGFGFIISVVLARILGTSDYGLYVYVFSIMELLTLLGTVGLDSLLVRDVAIYKTNSSWGLLHGLLKWSNEFVLGACAVIITLVMVGFWIAGDIVAPYFKLSFTIGLIFLPIACLRNIKIASMDGLQQFFRGHLPDFFVRPILFIIAFFSGYFLLKSKIDAPITVVIHVLVGAITLLITTILLRKNTPEIVWQEKPEYQVKKWLTTSLPLLFYASLMILYYNVDTLMLGAMKGVALVGIYDAMLKGKLIMYMVNRSVGSVLQPNVASLYAQGEAKQMERLVIKSGRLLFLIVFCMSVGLIIFSKWYLSLFGSDFIQGQTGLILLCVITIIDNIAPFNILLLNMTGHEKDTVLVTGISSVLNVILNFLLIPQWGLVGLILATAVSNFLLNLYAIIIVYRKLKINCTIFNFSSYTQAS